MSKLKIFNRLCLIVCFSHLVSCSTFYYGYSKEAWKDLTVEEQTIAKLEYAEILKEHNKNIHGNPAEKANEAFKDRLKAHGQHSLPDPI